VRTVIAWALFLAACSSGTPPKKEPYGVLPSATTSAEPLWIPFSLNAGSAFPADPRETRLTDVRRITDNGGSTRPRWSADSQRLYYESGDDKRACPQLYEVRLVDGKTRRVSPQERMWARWAVPGVEETLMVLADPAATACTGVHPSAWTASWQLEATDLYAAREGAPPRPLFAAPGWDGDLAGPVDGSLVTFTSSRDNDLEIYVGRADGANLVRVTNEAGYDGQPALSPDGAKLAWVSSRDDVVGYQGSLAKGIGVVVRSRIMLAGSLGQHPRALAHGDCVATPSFLPDSQQLIFTSSHDSAFGCTDSRANHELYVVDPDGPVTATGSPRVERVTFHDGYDGDAVVSPDGRYVAFTSTRAAATTTTGAVDIYVARWH
jgi:Tol biopolymer transport system component